MSDAQSEEEEEEEDADEEEEEDDELNNQSVAIDMAKVVDFPPSTLLHPAPCSTFTRAANPLLRLASRTSMKLLCSAAGGDAARGAAAGVTAPYYPIFLPIDQDFKAKYIWHHRMAKRGRSVKERTYSFLEHPVGWIGFTYHFSV